MTEKSERTEPDKTTDVLIALPNSSRRSLKSRFMMLARRVHLYAGLFLLPWVFLYGITGAMYNHQTLFPHQEFRQIPRSVIEASRMSEFPNPHALAADVVKAIQASDGGASIELSADPGAEFTSDLMFEVNVDGHKHVVHINPAGQAAFVAIHPPEDFKPQRLLQNINHIQIESNPIGIARESASLMLKETGIMTSEEPLPFGWAKLNFLASLDSQPVRVTYVLKDGHVDVTKYDGQHGMSLRGFFLRLHTSHGQSPHWNGRMLWSLFVDAMAIAMVTWGLTGILMWWQIKRTRRLGAIIILISISTALTMLVIMTDFYASTTL